MHALSGEAIILKVFTSCLNGGKFLKNIQSNFNGSNTFGTIKISSRQREFKPMRVNYSTRSEGQKGISFRYS